MTKQKCSPNQNKGAITRSTNKKATVLRLQAEMMFWTEMAKIEKEAKLAAIGSYLLEILANEE